MHPSQTSSRELGAGDSGVQGHPLVDSDFKASLDYVRSYHKLNRTIRGKRKRNTKEKPCAGATAFSLNSNTAISRREHCVWAQEDASVKPHRDESMLGNRRI